MTQQSRKIDFSSFTKEKLRDYWCHYSSQVDFSNPIMTEEYYRTFYENFAELTIFKQEFDSKDLLFTRARIHNSPNTLLPNLKDVWYPPEDVVRLGRCNLPKKPVFYCSNDPGTTIFEMRPKKGDWITSVEIEVVKKPLLISILGADSLFTPAFEKLSEVDKGINLYFERIFREIIGKGQEHNYYKTAMIVFPMLRIRDAVAYPSIGSNCKGTNVVFTRNFVDNHTVFRRAFAHEVIEKNSDYDIRIQCKYSSDSINQFGDFQWLRVNDCRVHTIDENIYHHPNKGA